MLRALSFLNIVLLVLISWYSVSNSRAGEVPKAIYAIRSMPSELPMFSIYSAVTKQLLFKGACNIRRDKKGCGISFIHDGKHKWVSGNIWIEPEPSFGRIDKLPFTGPKK